MLNTVLIKCTDNFDIKNSMRKMRSKTRPKSLLTD